MNIFTKFKKLSMVKISKTYVPKATEKYMCAKHLAYFKLKLNEWKTDLKRSNNEAIAQASMDDNSASADIVDQASSYTEKNVEMRAIDRQIKLTTKIDGKTCCNFVYCSPRKARKRRKSLGRRLRIVDFCIFI